MPLFLFIASASVALNYLIPCSRRRCSGTGSASTTNTTATATKPLTVFYSGGVAVFHLPQDKVQEDFRSIYAHG
jgi:hypothetical protein